MPQITITLSQDQLDSLNEFAKHPSHLEYVYDASVGQNVPRRKYADGSAYLLARVAQVVGDAVATCPTPSAKAKRDEIARLQAELDQLNKSALAVKVG
jgi:hypothetical protein